MEPVKMAERLKYPTRAPEFDDLVDKLEHVISGAFDMADVARTIQSLPSADALVQDYPAPHAPVVLVVNSQGIVVSQNAAAVRLLRLEPGCCIAEIMETPDSARLFLARRDFSSDPVPIVVATPDGDTMLLLGVTHEDGGLITLYEVRRGLDDRVQQQLAETIGLSAGEKRVYLRLLEGKTADMIATELTRTAGTVRQQIKAILAKAGVRSQMQLVSLA